ncbi:MULTISPECIES: diaminopimelate dehydrogenase [Acinetobacter]|jgi:diaminopimelate dehydrogenase|uniref:Meso-diaminopimelate D-dehydrogenase n=1 Tax=Acinetobacter towneri TaxID=202956 RepID=A0AAP4HF68_9GAMM|nr:MULTISPECIES: diaminopimelate dehydrogenase [Acinetobacter]GIT83294.1 meso-diaminopimelate D-dehydrogenase [Acinetobacter seohaensis]AVH50354.1 diaminopimelate dehydrogenase [Acinetobacter sp. SWBY1]ENV70339.1 diaminopimelate dehydrogenase [Acinetobacter towneri DSM 14962 = CIP 107472]MBT0888259.1 diaminopimelate dehydrogenase [Acinetobacter towneri]MCA4790593.1 diaminopimelate dehydrogenase [Acinetobacter towneri]
MQNSIRIGIAGYGNLGRGVETAIHKNPDLQLVGIFTRRAPESVSPCFAETAVFHMDSLSDFQDKIDVLILCGGSKDDLPQQGPVLASQFNIVDSFDTHARIPEYYASVDAPATANKKTALISIGWDPGMFSINRLFGEALLPDGETYTFWGKGLSQGHSDAIRRVDGVKAGVQYTIPSNDAIEQVRSGARPVLSTKDKHTRECYVVLAEGADAAAVEQAIVTMPDYFADYNTTVNFIDEATLAKDHQRMPHGGFVIRSGNTSDEQKQVLEFSLKLDSNPEFTASILVAYARACYRLNQMQQYGAKTAYDVAPGLLSMKSPEQLRAELL